MFSVANQSRSRPLLLLAAILLVICQTLSISHLHPGLENLTDHKCATCLFQDTVKAAVDLAPIPPCPHIAIEQAPQRLVSTFTNPVRSYSTRAPPVYA